MHMVCWIQTPLPSVAWEQLFQTSPFPAAMLVCVLNPERWSNQYKQTAGLNKASGDRAVLWTQSLGFLCLG